MSKQLYTCIAVAVFAFTALTVSRVSLIASGAQCAVSSAEPAPARAQDPAASDIELYKQWRLQRDTPDGLELATRLIRQWPCSNAAGAVFNHHYWDHRTTHEARCAVSQAYVDSVTPALASPSVAQASVDARRNGQYSCGDYTRWALGYLAANGDDPIAAREYFRRYCAAYDCSGWPLPEFAKLPAAPSN